jgi:hypothetical protein
MLKIICPLLLLTMLIQSNVYANADIDSCADLKSEKQFHKTRFLNGTYLFVPSTAIFGVSLFKIVSHHDCPDTMTCRLSEAEYNIYIISTLISGLLVYASVNSIVYHLYKIVKINRRIKLYCGPNSVKLSYSF